MTDEPTTNISVERIEANDGDILTVTVPTNLDWRERQRVFHYISAYYLDRGKRVLVIGLDPGTTIDKIDEELMAKYGWVHADKGTGRWESLTDEGRKDVLDLLDEAIVPRRHLIDSIDTQGPHGVRAVAPSYRAQVERFEAARDTLRGDT